MAVRHGKKTFTFFTIIFDLGWPWSGPDLCHRTFTSNLKCRERYNVGRNGGQYRNQKWACDWHHDLDLCWFKVIKITRQIFQNGWQIRWWDQQKSKMILPIGYRWASLSLTLDDLDPITPYMANSCLDNGVGNSMHWADTRSIERFLLITNLTTCIGCDYCILKILASPLSWSGRVGYRVSSLLTVIGGSGRGKWTHGHLNW